MYKVTLALCLVLAATCAVAVSRLHACCALPTFCFVMALLYGWVRDFLYHTH